MKKRFAICMFMSLECTTKVEHAGYGEVNTFVGQTLVFTEWKRYDTLEEAEKALEKEVDDETYTILPVYEKEK